MPPIPDVNVDWLTDPSKFNFNLPSDGRVHHEQGKSAGLLISIPGYGQCSTQTVWLWIKFLLGKWVGVCMHFELSNCTIRSLSKKKKLYHQITISTWILCKGDWINQYVREW